MNPIAVFIVMLLGGVIAASIAASKYRRVDGWFVFGSLFPVITIVCALCAEKGAPPQNLSAGW